MVTVTLEGGVYVVRGDGIKTLFFNCLMDAEKFVAKLKGVNS